jgi:hypothetical protein
MDTTRFDEIARGFGGKLTRRETVQGLVASALGLAAGGALLGDASARKRRKRKRKNKSKRQSSNGSGNGGQLLPAGALCQQDAQCDPTRTNRICDVAANASNSDETCCGAQNASCGLPNENGDDTGPFCCAGYVCRGGRGSSTGLCLSLADMP